MKKIKQIVNKLLFPNDYCSEAYVRFLRRGGAKIGEGTHFYSPKAKPVDETSLPFIEIGENCRITTGVRILAHDYSYAVLRPLYHHMLCKTGVTKIGNNVFIGMNSIIAMGCQIGNNVIVGAGSIVTKDIPDNVVVGGNPARVICTMEEYYQKNYSLFEEYARTYFLRMQEFYGRDPLEKEMSWFVSLWGGKLAEEVYRSAKVDGDDKEAVISDMLSVPPRYESFAAFMESFQAPK